MKIEKIKIKNYKVFKDVEIRNLPNVCVFLGANGVGKTTLFDVFGFLSDALKSNVKTALNKRGGFNEVISRESEGDISFEIKFRNEIGNKQTSPLITYELSIGLNQKNQPIVTQETLSYRRGSIGKPYRFLDFSNGRGSAITNEEEFEKEKQNFKDKREEQTLDAPDILAIKGLGQFQKFKAISSFRRLLENWFVSNFQIQSAQNIEDIGLSEHLSTNGNNLAQVTKFIYDNHREIFENILKKMAERIPDITKVNAEETKDGRIILQFQDGSFKDPFISRYVSDGTLKMFAYLILLNDPSPHPLLCVEEPENYLHHELLRELAEEFREYAQKGGQVFISTHSPDFVNMLKIEEVFWLNKKNGHTKIQHAKDDKVVTELAKSGDLIGSLWKQGYLMGSGIKK
ncbi:MAG: chromosome segregation protein SMC [Cytophagales bacterium]|nr:MAG: chromosome segregation protein SMC [Cytophagales bacterium]TAH28069.1 MAG: chromosome segregation protein SMC [Cytophagales bacterium]